MKCRIDFIHHILILIGIDKTFSPFHYSIFGLITWVIWRGKNKEQNRIDIWKSCSLEAYINIYLKIHYNPNSLTLFCLSYRIFSLEIRLTSSFSTNLFFFLPPPLFSISFSFILRFIISRFLPSEKDMLNTFDEICSNIRSVIKSEKVQRIKKKKNLLFFVQVATSNPVRNNNFEYLFNKDFSFV